MNTINWLIVMMVLLLQSSLVVSINSIQSRVLNNQDFNKVLRGIIRIDEQITYRFELDKLLEYHHYETKIRVEVTTNRSTSLIYPIYFSIIQREEVTPITVPFALQISASASDKNNTIDFFGTSRLLCMSANAFTEEKTVSIRVSTESVLDVGYKLRVTAEKTMRLNLDKLVSTEISLRKPDFFYFSFSNISAGTVIVKVEAEKKMCMFLALQEAHCPIFAREHDLKYQGIWQTFLNKGAITVQQNQYKNGFYIKLIMAKDGSSCGSEIASSENSGFYSDSYIRGSNTVNITVQPGILEGHENLIHFAHALALPIYVSVIIAAFIGICYIPIYKVTSKDNFFGKKLPEGSLPIKKFCADMGATETSLSSRTFWRMNVVISLITITPVYALTIYNLRTLYHTGNWDICYFNNRCSVPHLGIQDFNHFYSNIVYLLLGAAFIIIAYIKNRCCLKIYTDLYGKKDDQPQLDEIKCILRSGQDKFGMTDDEIDGLRAKDFGIQPHFGLYYAMGVSLIMEGVMSAAYHICPNKANFQFDTMYMYIISAMCILKQFEFRHPKFLGPNLTYAILSSLCLTCGLGLLLEGLQLPYYVILIFKAILAALYVIILALLIIYLIYLGYPIDNIGSDVTTMKDIFRALKVLPNCKKLRRPPPRQNIHHRYSFVAVLIIINAGMIVFLFHSNLARTILCFLLVNSMIYFFYYILMKFCYCELINFGNSGFQIRWRVICPLVFCGLTAAFGYYAVQYFSINLTEWNVSPAESRLGNEECIFLDFYDQHDIWHMLSGFAVFFLFMTLLCIDDAVQRRCQQNLLLF